MTNGLLIYGEIFAHFLIYWKALPHIWLCNCSTLNFLIYEENLIFFLSVCSIPLPGLKGTLLRNQATSAAGLALETLQDTSTFSFSRFSMREPDRCPTNSIRFGGTVQKVTNLISINCRKNLRVSLADHKLPVHHNNYNDWKYAQE